MWADFSLKDLGEPFRMWYIYADNSKKQTKEHERLLKLYRRAKNRKKTHSIIKAWRHLVSAAFLRLGDGALLLLLALARENSPAMDGGSMVESKALRTSQSKLSIPSEGGKG